MPTGRSCHDVGYNCRANHSDVPASQSTVPSPSHGHTNPPAEAFGLPSAVVPVSQPGQNIHITAGRNKTFYEKPISCFYALDFSSRDWLSTSARSKCPQTPSRPSAALDISPTRLAPAQTSPKTSRACRLPAYPLPLESNSEKGPFVAQGYHLHASVPPFEPLAP